MKRASLLVFLLSLGNCGSLSPAIAEDTIKVACPENMASMLENKEFLDTHQTPYRVVSDYPTVQAILAEWVQRSGEDTEDKDKVTQLLIAKFPDHVEAGMFADGCYIGASYTASLRGFELLLEAVQDSKI